MAPNPAGMARMIASGRRRTEDSAQAVLAAAEEIHKAEVSQNLKLLANLVTNVAVARMEP